MLVVKRRVKLEAYKIFESVYSEWRRDPHLSFQIPRPVTYRPSEAMLERTWVKGKRVLAIYFLMPKQLSGIIYGIEPSTYAEKSAEFLAWLHDLKKMSNRVNVKNLQRNYVTQMRKVVDSCLRSRLINESIANNIEYKINRISEYDGWGPVSLIHGDFKTQNVLIAGRNLAIIDFEGTRHDFSYLDLARFVCNIRLRSNKYPFVKENRIDFLTSTFVRKYEKMCGKIDKRAFLACYLRDLLEELKIILHSYSIKARGSKASVGNFLIRRQLDYLVKETLLLRNE